MGAPDAEGAVMGKSIKPPPNRGLHAVKFSMEQRRLHIAHQLSGGHEDKRLLLLELPLLDVAVRGGLAVGRPFGQRTARLRAL